METNSGRSLMSLLMLYIRHSMGWTSKRDVRVGKNNKTRYCWF